MNNDTHDIEGRDDKLSELSAPQRQVYSFLKNRHIENQDRRLKTVSTSTIEARLGLEHCEHAIEELTSRGLAVRKGNDVMWMPRISNKLQDTLEKIRRNCPVENDKHAECLIDMGLVSPDNSGGYRYEWEQGVSIQNQKERTANQVTPEDQLTVTVRAEIGVVLPENCPIADVSITANTSIENVSRAVVQTPDDTLSEEFTVGTGVSVDHQECSEISPGVYRFSRNPNRNCVCDVIERFGCPVNDIQAQEGTLIVSFLGAEPTIRDIIDKLQERFTAVDVRQLAPAE